MNQNILQIDWTHTLENCCCPDHEMMNTIGLPLTVKLKWLLCCYDKNETQNNNKKTKFKFKKRHRLNSSKKNANNNDEKCLTNKNGILLSDYELYLSRSSLDCFHSIILSFTLKRIYWKREMSSKRNPCPKPWQANIEQKTQINTHI